MSGSIELISPFPSDQLPQAHKWFINSPAAVNRMTLQEFSEWVGSAFSIGISAGGSVVGMILFEPVRWTGQKEPTDFFVTFGLARRVWGQGILERVKGRILSTLFWRFPKVTRITGYTKDSNKAAQRAALSLGCKEEGRVRDVFTEGEDVVMYGLTRKDFYGGRQ